MTTPIKFAQPLTQLEADLHSIEQPLLALDSYLSLCAHQLNAALDTFWNLPDERVEAILNHYGPEQVNVIFTAHAEKATMVNMLMEARGLAPTARIGAAREIEVNPDTGLLRLKPLPVPEEPEPEELAPPAEA